MLNQPYNNYSVNIRFSKAIYAKNWLKSMFGIFSFYNIILLILISTNSRKSIIHCNDKMNLIRFIHYAPVIYNWWSMRRDYSCFWMLSRNAILRANVLRSENVRRVIVCSIVSTAISCKMDLWYIVLTL